MKTICIFNYKGGVGKTTTAINLAAGLSRKNKKVLLIDLDPQGNVDTSLKTKAEYGLYDALSKKLTIQQCITNVAANLDIITSKENLIKIEHYLSQNSDSRLLLKKMLESVKGYDYLLIDCPPSLGLLNQNALAFAQEVFIPVATDFLSYHALQKMAEIIPEINQHYNHNLKISKIIPTFYDRRNKICKEMLARIQNDFPQLASFPIRQNSKLKEAPMHGQSIFSYAKSSPGAEDYQQLVEDVLQMEEKAEDEIAAKHQL